MLSRPCLDFSPCLTEAHCQTQPGPGEFHAPNRIDETKRPKEGICCAGLSGDDSFFMGDDGALYPTRWRAAHAVADVSLVSLSGGVGAAILAH